MMKILASDDTHKIKINLTAYRAVEGGKLDKLTSHYAKVFLNIYVVIKKSMQLINCITQLVYVCACTCVCVSVA